MKESTKIVIGTLVVVAVGFLLWRAMRGPRPALNYPEIESGEDSQGVTKWEGEVIVPDPEDVIIRRAK